MSDFVAVEIDGCVPLYQILTFDGLVPLRDAVHTSVNSTIGTVVANGEQNPRNSHEPMATDSTQSIPTEIRVSNVDVDYKNQTCGHTYLKCLYYSGFALFKNRSHEKDIFTIIKQLPFCVVSLHTLLYATLFVLLNLSLFLESKEKTTLVDFLYSLEILVFCLYVVFFLGTKAVKIQQVFTQTQEYIHDIGLHKSYIVRYHQVTILAWVLTIALAATRVFILFGEGSLRSLILNNANLWDEVVFTFGDKHGTSYPNVTFFNFTMPANMINSSSSAESHEQSSLASKYTLGCLTAFAQLCFYTITDAIQNLLIIQALQINVAVRGFVTEIKEASAIPFVSDPSVASELLGEQWKKYSGLRNLMEHSNALYGTLLKLTHVKNLFLFGYFLAGILVEDQTGFFLGSLIYTMMKGAQLYYFSSRSSGKNDTIRRWIKRQSNPAGSFVAGEKSWNTSLLLTDLDEEEIGFGRGSFLIGEGFVFRFLGIVGSLAFFLVDDAKGNVHLL